MSKSRRAAGRGAQRGAKPSRGQAKVEARRRRAERPTLNRFRSDLVKADTDRVLTELAKIPGGATAYQLSTLLGLTPEASRETGQLLRRLVEQGLVLESRPGRYQVSGAGGEYSVMVEEASEGGGDDDKGRIRLQARFSDEKVLPIHPRHTLGARGGDVCQAAIGEDQQVLVTRILRRSGREIVGTVNFRPQGLVFIADNRREGDMPVLSAFRHFDREYRAGDRVVATVEIDGEGRAGVHVTSVLGDESPEVADFRYARLTHDLPGEFPEETEAEARSFDPVLPAGRREDLRKELVFTIDPVTAKDFDDAISLRPRPQGGYQLGVHIADVSHYVREGNPLDQEAAARGTSIYLINRVIPMLPEVLSNGLCSLVPDEDRYCLSAFLDLDKDGKLVGSRFAETIIRSRHRLSYEQALSVIQGEDPGIPIPDDLKRTIVTVSEIAQKLRRAREAAGAINLYSVEHRFKLDVNGLPIEVIRESSDIAHQLIEECMLLANRAVASWLVQKGFPCVFRLHSPPDAEKMKQFAGVVEAYGLDPGDVTTRGGLQTLLKRLSEEPPAARLVLNFMCLRSFKKAVYGIENTGHFALAFEHYAHFTSPIRRYPDLLVHRLVKRALKLNDYKDVEIRPSYLDPMSKQSSYLEQRAESAERTLHSRKSARYLSTRIGDTFPAVVTGATGGALFAQLLETGMEGLVPVRALGDDYYEFDPERLALVGRRSGRVFGPGTELDIQVVSVDIQRSDIVLGLADGARAVGPGR
ncbi:MAG: VacB/RNase II family 3'-5' exoribonuclease, partial [Planctomycetes bacterium]|nr:VacB/RNase II family 3'-5' exoribonuclease [Planctomycetota bacterium]